MALAAIRGHMEFWRRDLRVDQNFNDVSDGLKLWIFTHPFNICQKEFMISEWASGTPLITK